MSRLSAAVGEDRFAAGEAVWYTPKGGKARRLRASTIYRAGAEDNIAWVRIEESERKHAGVVKPCHVSQLCRREP